MEISQRIAEVLQYSGFSATEFADEIGVQRSSLSHISSGRNKPSLEFIMKIKSRFPDIEWDWLITGSGEMLASEKQIKEESDIAQQKPASLPDLLNFVENDLERELQDADSTPKHKENIPEEKLNVQPANIVQENSAKKIIEDVPKNKINRIVIFYKNGKFESFEP